ncbi:MAG: NifU family protein [Gemmatimonadetes bacterium]|uniref:NifU family protein n=1 Tax=Candidatus Kutchimonas denitrificans TaxID=3056748 RepID=A0AAE4ZCW6_9BACT|nr:NifU family protein [Gemmatimonadota bacterium]NIR75580.1 NifU family protein [Candidatus Kutchimonas denitrificans]NIS01894.1 NifU family protein [Gemmatimonadota bacterium]NIT67675.1 NifU family protein [Gemmatimonadota bacterium]NIU53549.1 NifU family protein [Gemmatimonadota bacterium]
MTTTTTWDRIEAVIDEVRPAVRADGGDIELVGFDESEGRVELRLVGACHSCPYSLMTLKGGIEHRLRNLLPEVKTVVAL